MSYCCVRKKAIDQIGSDPFSIDLNAVEDSYLCYRLALLGPIGFLPATLVAYRITEGSLSVNRVRNLGLWTTAFERLEAQYLAQGSRPLAHAFSKFYASKRREFAKVLMGVNRKDEAKNQLFQSLRNCRQPFSLMKSLVLLLQCYLPKMLQPTWPSPIRVVKQPAIAATPRNCP
jgi:hypothetical protein